MATTISLATSIQTFGSDLFERLADKEGNICLSPLSIVTCFALLIEGSDGNTRQQLMDTFHFSPDYLVQFEAAFDAFEKSKVSIKIANSLWADEKKPLKTEFVSTLLKYFKEAQLKNVNFNSEAAVVKQINSWVNQQTQGHIPSVLRNLPRNTLLMLVNAVYFCGKWKKEFKSTDTCDKKFRMFDKQSVKVPMMHQTEKMKHVKTDTFAAISLPYKEDSSMFIILPNGISQPALDQCCTGKFLSEFFNEHRHQMKTKKVALTMPKFTFTNEFNLSTTLKAMGLANIFSPTLADFSKLTTDSNGAFISQAVHKTFIEVDEEGTRASAVTAIQMMKRRRSDGPTLFEVDHPFVYAIFHHPTEQLLFLGKVVNPSQQHSENDNVKKRGSEDVEDKEYDEAKSPGKKQKL